MFEVAFSRRMCCSRVWRVRTKPRLPSRSRVSPAIRPGMRRIRASVAAKKPNDGPPKSRRLPSVCPSPTAMSTPHSPGGLSSGERKGVAGADRQRTLLARPLGHRADVLDGAQEVRLLEDHGADVLVELGQVGDAVAERRLDHLHVPSARERAQHLARVGMDAARDDEAAAAVGQLGHVAGGAHRARSFVDRRVRDGQRGQLGDRRLVLEHRLQSALGDLGLVGRVRGQELGALDDRVDDRRHVVVVHAGAEERDLILGGDVLRRERPQLLEHLLLGRARRDVERLGQAQGRRDVGEQILDRLDADRREHLAAVFLGG